MSEEGERLPRGIPYGWIVHNNTLRKLYISHIIRDTTDFGDVIDRFVCNLEDEPVEEDEIRWDWPHISVAVGNVLSEDSPVVQRFIYGNSVREDH